MIKRTLFFAFVSFLPWLAATIAAQAQEHPIETDENSRIDITVTQAFTNMPLKGYLPLRVSINNRSGSQGTWTIAAKPRHSSDARSLWSRQLTVPAGQKREFDLLYPSLGFPFTEIFVTGPKTKDSFYIHSPNAYSYANSDSTYGVASEGIVNSVNSSQLDSYFENNGVSINPNDRRIRFLPTDWRGYTAADLLWFQQLDWAKATPEERRAILQWVAQGGDLRIRKDKGTPEDAVIAGLPIAKKQPIPYGAGVIRVYPYLSEEELLQYPEGHSTARENEIYSARVKEAYGTLGANFWLPAQSDNTLSAAVENSDSEDTVSLTNYYDAQPHAVAFGVIFISVLGFVIVVGPLNFWIFARGRKRYRLFFTTPLISIAFCILISAFILVADGVGGSGRYSRLFIHADAGSHEILIEEQYARTGLLLRRDFKADTGTWVVPLGFYIANPREEPDKTGVYRNTDEAYDGDWFGSRRTQGIAMTTQRPTRANFEILEKDGERYVLSSFPAVCPVLYLTGGNGETVYRALNVTTGVPAKLESVQRETFKSWLADAIARLGQETRQRIRYLDVQPGHIYASIEDYSGQAPQSLQSIDWQPYQSLVIAPARGIDAITEENPK